MSTWTRSDLLLAETTPFFGIAFRDDIPWYLICEDMDDDYPTPHCSIFFELVDATICEGWTLSLGPSNIGTTAILPREWASDAHFLERLIDGDDNAIGLFRELKNQYAGG